MFRPGWGCRLPHLKVRTASFIPCGQLVQIVVLCVQDLEPVAAAAAILQSRVDSRAVLVGL